MISIEVLIRFFNYMLKSKYFIYDLKIYDRDTFEFARNTETCIKVSFYVSVRTKIRLSLFTLGSFVNIIVEKIKLKLVLEYFSIYLPVGTKIRLSFFTLGSL